MRRFYVAGIVMFATGSGIILCSIGMGLNDPRIGYRREGEQPPKESLSDPHTLTGFVSFVGGSVAVSGALIVVAAANAQAQAVARRELG